MTLLVIYAPFGEIAKVNDTGTVKVCPGIGGIPVANQVGEVVDIDFAVAIGRVGDIAGYVGRGNG